MADHPFAGYLAEQPAQQRHTLETMAACLRQILPSAEESLSYAMPAFYCDGTAIAGIAGFKHHCSYFPHSGAVLSRVAADLAGYDFDDGTLRMPIDQPLPAALLRKLVVAKLELENERAARKAKARTFYDNGRLKSRGGMRLGETHGEWIFFRRDGSILRTGRFVDGRRCDVWRTFDRTGNLVKETQFARAPRARSLRP